VANISPGCCKLLHVQREDDQWDRQTKRYADCRSQLVIIYWTKCSGLLQIRPAIKPSGQFVCPVPGSLGNAEIPMAKKVEVKDRGSYDILV